MRNRQFQDLARRLETLNERLRTIEVATLVSGPSNPVVAEAYDGLRKQVIVSASSRRAHLTQLATFADAVESGATNEELSNLVREWMRQHGLRLVVPIERPDVYDIKGDGTLLKVIRAGYVDEQTGAIVALGQAIASTAPTIEPLQSDAAKTLQEDEES
jgi:hypothetical protein